MIESEPCPEQRATMEALGFQLCATEDSNISVWRFFCVELRYGNAANPTPRVAIGHALQEAISIGEQRRATAIAKLLKA